MTITILDTCSLEDIDKTHLRKDDRVTVKVLGEVDAWKNAEQQSVKFDPLINAKRMGIEFAKRNLGAEALRKFERKYGNSIYKYNNTLSISRLFRKDSSRVHDFETGEFFEQFRGLLTKTLAYEVARDNPGLVKAYMHDRSVVRQLTDLAMDMYRTEAMNIAAREFNYEPDCELLYEGIANELCKQPEKRDRLKDKITNICRDLSDRVHNISISGVRDSIEKFHNGVTADLNLVSTAYAIAEMAGEDVRILSDDLDVREAVEYAMTLQSSCMGISVVGKHSETKNKKVVNSKPDYYVGEFRMAG
ncbi:MAG: hypothetical protein U9R08_06130 [Nanoarchaeota archaeon]|nr:hypothetical protein [Nanoarchaeota archaeon]